MTDPFAEPASIPSEFPSAASFKKRLVLLQPEKLELDVPNTLTPGKLEDRVTVTVTVVDGEGDVQLCPQQVPSGVYVPGPVYKGVRFTQDRIVKALAPGRKFSAQMRLGRLDTFKPGPAKQGNPWGMEPPTEADKQVARDFLAKQAMEQAAAAVAQASGNDDDAPF